MEIQGKYSVYIVNNENKVESRQINVGGRVDDFWLVSEGLSPGEMVIIDALQKVTPGINIKPQVTEFKSKSSVED